MHLPLRCQLHRLGPVNQATKARSSNVHLTQGDKKDVIESPFYVIMSEA